MSRISREDVSIIIMSSLLLLEAIKLWLQVVMFRGARRPPPPPSPPSTGRPACAMSQGSAGESLRGPKTTVCNAAVSVIKCL